ncbi:hypothetical protein GCM10007935_11460 [Hydrogenophaga electricum]|uniref:UmuC domain-containing protein n=1 Tax=Hydrogenophaga electricum TaxID=1230953 RepID=A0ABQ6C5T4_9BURK|nr:hypothetical protein GCM10007935_11460 [Hydrogenophaga electricum]
MFGLTPYRRPVFAIQRDIEDASAELGTQLGLQLQAFLHPRLDTAVVVADRQCKRTGLGPSKNVARVRFHE